MVSLAERRRAVMYIKDEYGINERHACQAMQMNRYGEVGRPHSAVKVPLRRPRD